MVREILALSFATAFAYAQPKFELRGTVTDPNTSQPLQGVEVTMLQGNGLVSPGTKTEQVITDSQGMFCFQPSEPGQYVVRIRKDGYTQVGWIPSSTQGTAMLSESKPSAVFALFLERPAGISGRVVDDETEKPVGNLKVGINGYRSTNGRVSARGSWATTNGDGGFQYSVAAGNYLIEIQQYMNGENHILTTFTEEDIRATDTGYRSQFFPGRAGADSGLPIPVTSGGSANVGTIRIRKQPLYEPDDDRDAVRHIAADVDGKFQITGIVPGEYRLFAVAAKDRAQAEQPAPWQRLVSRAEKLALARGASRDLVIQVSDPAR